MTHVVVVDGTNLLVQAKAVSQGITIVCDEECNPAPMLIFGRALARRLRAIQPVDHLIVAWEGDHSTVVRQSLVPSYKSGGGVVDDPYRRLIEEWVELIGGKNASFSMCEADDVIALVARTARFDLCTILSDDGDFFQLVTEKVRQIKLRPGPVEAMTWDLTRVEATMGRPEWVPIYKAFVGDRSDGIAGVEGVGPARCRKLGDRYGWCLASMMNDPMCVAHAKRIEANYVVTSLLGSLVVTQAVGHEVAVADLLVPFVPRPDLEAFYERCNIDPIDLMGEVANQIE